ncbi:MAG: hypothetical protein ICV54_15395 [Nostoc sp. C3-bin3]|nr:hypothetical protein [Nostoc sp. C3-bin3]
MGFAAIAVGIGIHSASGRQAMHYAYAPKISSIKMPKNNFHLKEFAVGLHS